MPRIVHDHTFIVQLLRARGDEPKAECRCGAVIRRRRDRGSRLMPSYALVQRGSGHLLELRESLGSPATCQGKRKETA